jgi:palmitoyltransferase ZDHHC9/14/18
MNQSLGKSGDDIEMGRKAVWEMNAGMDDSDTQLNNDRASIKDGELSEIRTTVDETVDRAGIHPRRSSWGRKSGSWEMSPEVLALAARVGEQNRAGEGNSGSTRDLS